MRQLRCKFAVNVSLCFCGYRFRASRDLKNSLQSVFIVLVALFLSSYNKAIKLRSASLHWTAYGGRLLQR